MQFDRAPPAGVPEPREARRFPGLSTAEEPPESPVDPLQRGTLDAKVEVAEIRVQRVAAKRRQTLELVLPGNRLATSPPRLDTLIERRVVELAREREDLGDPAMADRRDPRTADERAVHEGHVDWPVCRI